MSQLGDNSPGRCGVVFCSVDPGGAPQCRLASSMGRPLAERLVGLRAGTWPMSERQGVGETLMEMAPSVISHCRDEEKQLRKFSLTVLVVSFIPRHSETVSDSGWGKKPISSAGRPGEAVGAASPPIPTVIRGTRFQQQRRCVSSAHPTPFSETRAQNVPGPCATAHTPHSTERHKVPLYR